MKTNAKKRMLISSVAMLLIAMIALGTATFAWFTTSTNPYADQFSAKTTKQSTLLLSDNSRTGWTSHLQYGVADKLMYPASGNGTTWVKGTASDALTGAIDNSSLKAVLPTPDADVTSTADYVFVNELNLKNNGTAYITDVKITFFMNTEDNKKTADYARVALVPVNGTEVGADELVALGDNVYSTTAKTYKPIINTAGALGDQINTKTEFTVNVTADGEAMAPDEIKYYKLFVWFEGQDDACTDANSGKKIPGLKFEVTSTMVKE